MNREKREKLVNQVQDASDAADQAISQINGNPQMIQAIEALRDELNALEEAINLDIEV